MPARYDLRETRTRAYPERTKLNVRDSDGTAIFFRGRLDGGSKRTEQFAVKAGKPSILVRLDDPSTELAATVSAFRTWVRANRVAVLNVAGSRESKSAGIHDEVKRFLLRALSPEPDRAGEGRPLAEVPAMEELPLAAEAPAEYRRSPPTGRRSPRNG